MKRVILFSGLIGWGGFVDNAGAGRSEAAPAGSTHTLLVESNEGSPWVVESLVSWITINGSNSGAGAGAVSYTVNGNDSSRTRSGKIRVSYADVAVTSWVTSTVDSSGMVGRENSLSFGPDGHPRISYYDETNTALKFAAFDGSSWSTQVVDNAGAVGRHTSLSHDANGNPAISYQDFTAGHLKFASFDGLTWNIQAVDMASDVGGYGTSLSHDPDGLPAISYFSRSNTGLKFSAFDGQSWLIQDADEGASLCTLEWRNQLFIGWGWVQVCTSDASSRGEYSSMRHSPEGLPSISYMDTDNYDLVFADYYRDNVANVWKWRDKTVDDDGLLDGTTSLDYGPDGHPAIAYHEFTGSLRFSWRQSGEPRPGFPDGTSWSKVIVDEGKAGYSSLDFNSRGNPAISYFDQNNADLKYAWRDGDAWRIETVDQVGEVGEYTSLSHGPDDELPAISYYDKSNGNLKFARLIDSAVVVEVYHTVIQEAENPGGSGIVFGALQLPCTGSPVEVSAQSVDGQPVNLLFYEEQDGELILLEEAPAAIGSYRVMAITRDGSETAIETMVIEAPYLAEDQGRAQSNDCRRIECTTWECSGVGSENFLSVLLGEGVAWSVESSVPWITITGDESGTGPGNVIAEINYHTNNSVRNGQIRLTYHNDVQNIEVIESHTFFQGPLDSSIDTDGDGISDLTEITGKSGFVDYPQTNPRARDTDGDGNADLEEWFASTDPNDADSFAALMDSSGGTGNYTVPAPEGVSWTADSDVPWITITGPASGTGPGTVSYSVAPEVEEFMRIGQIRIRIADPNQTTVSWETVTVDNAGNVGWWDTSLSHDPDGNPAMSYYDNSNDDLKFASFVDGTGWTVRTIDSAGNVGRFNAIDHGPNGHPGIAYYDWTNRDLKFASFDGQRWDIELVESQDMIGTEVSLSYGPGGNPAISYHNVSSRDLKFASHDGQRWNTQTIASDGDVGRYGTSLKHGPGGNPAISYYDNSNDDLKFASFDGVAWKVSTVDSQGNVGRYSSLSYDPDGNPAISYYDYSNRDVKFASFDGLEWRIKTVDGDDNVGEYTSLSHGLDGNPAISYFDNSNDDLKFASFNGSSWEIEIIDQEGFVGQYTSLSDGPAGERAIVYYDNSNDNLKMAQSQASTGATRTVVHTVFQRSPWFVPGVGAAPEIKMQIHYDPQLLLDRQFEISFSTSRWVNYLIQSSTDLRNWQTVESGISGTGDVIRRSIELAGKARFFRIVSEN